MTISLDEEALTAHRHFPWSHNYVALAYKASGQLEKAKEMAGQAMIYESPWDEQDRADVREFHREHFF
jgi:Tfp pilus assembly protein PilF